MTLFSPFIFINYSHCINKLIVHIQFFFRFLNLRALLFNLCLFVFVFLPLFFSLFVWLKQEFISKETETAMKNEWEHKQACITSKLYSQLATDIFLLHLHCFRLFCLFVFFLFCMLLFWVLLFCSFPITYASSSSFSRSALLLLLFLLHLLLAQAGMQCVYGRAITQSFKRS